MKIMFHRHRFISSFAGFKKSYLGNDLLAALTVTAIAVPESLGFAVVAGLPLVTGLYCALVAPIVFALLTSSKRVVVGADSATAALVATGGSIVAVAGTAAYNSAIVTLGLLTAFILLIMALFKFGFIANFISKPVLVGFLAGVGLQLMLGKLPELLGFEVDGSFTNKITYMVTHLGSTDVLTLGIGATLIAIILLVGKTRFPGVLAGLLAGIALTLGFNLQQSGLHIVGALPSGLPHLVWPSLSPETIFMLFPTALTIAFIIVAQGTAIIRDMGAEHDEKVRIDQDIMAYGVANAASALTQGFAINGSPPRSLAAELSSGRSQFVNIFMGLFVGIILLFASSIFRYVPMVALAAIVFVIGLHLIRVKDFRRIYTTRRTEFYIALFAMSSVAVLGVKNGLFAAIIVSLLERLHRQYRTSDQILLRDGVLSDWAKARVHLDYHETREKKGLLIYQFNGSIFFDNADYFVHRLKRAVAEATQPVTYILIDAGSIDEIDYTAINSLRRLYSKLKADDVQLGFAHVSPHLMEQFKHFGVIDMIGRRHIYPTLNDALTSYYKQPRDVVSMIRRLDLPFDQFVVIGGAVMAELGLRSTHSADVVVTDELYTKLRDELGWREFVQDNGKCILSQEGFHAMRRWLGWGVNELRDDALVRKGVRYMNPAKLLEGKERLARPKDLADAKLLKKWLAKQHTAKEK